MARARSRGEMLKKEKRGGQMSIGLDGMMGEGHVPYVPFFPFFSPCRFGIFFNESKKLNGMVGKEGKRFTLFVGNG